MKNFKPLLILIIIFSFQHQSLNAQGWGILKGEPSCFYPVVKGKGIAHHNNTPGFRKGSATWIHNGKLYLYGGGTADDNWNINNYSFDFANDMWVFDTASRNWTWLSGTLVPDAAPIYGTKGVASSNNTPGKVEGGMTWTVNGKFYLLTPGMDMWMYDPATDYWTWLSGQYSKRPAVYGSVGVAADTVRPGHLSGSLTWEYNGRLYLYGGFGYDSTTSNISGWLNDIWEFDFATGYWKWIKGSKKKDATGTPGTVNVPSVANMPRALNYVMWFLNGKIYLSAPYDDFIWEYDQSTNNWTYIRESKWSAVINYGKKGIADTLNSPGPRTGSAAWVHNGKLYLYGGHMYKAHDPKSYYKEDLWELDPVTKYWTWVAGDSTANAQARYGMKGYWDKDTWPGPRMAPLTWQSGDRIFLIGDGIRNSDEIWEFDKITKYWRWIKGIHNSVSSDFYVEPYVTGELNEPGKFSQAKIWQTGDTIYAYGHNGNNILLKNILWRYEIGKNIWTPIKTFDDINPVYGQKGQPDSKNNPGFRYDSYNWIHNGKLYLFSGSRYGTGSDGDDLWEFDLKTNNWCWIKGDTVYKNPVFGIKGIAAQNNTPGTRGEGCTWSLNGKFYLFGGRATDINGKLGLMNDLWEFDPATMNWKWLKGSNQKNAFAEFGTKGMPAPLNTPGAREFASYCTTNNKLYLFGGYSYMEYDIVATQRVSNDFWEYDPVTNNWRWLSGTLNYFSGSIFGVKGVHASLNQPGRKRSASLVALNGKIYLHGGEGSHEIDHYDGGWMDDLWEYDVTLGHWAWIDGTKTYNNYGYYDLPLVCDLSYTHGSYAYSASWSYGSRLYFLGGEGFVANLFLGGYTTDATNALWCYDLCKDVQQCYSANPVIKLDSVITMCDNRALVINAGNVGSKYFWNTNDTTQSIQVVAPGKFWVKVINPAGKSSSDTVFVIKGGSPIISLVSDTLLCAPDSVVINLANSSATYYWSSGDTAAQPSVKKEGLYSVLAIDTNGCYNKDSVYIKVNPRPAKPNFGSNSPVCTGSDLYLVDSAGIQGKPYIYGSTGLLNQGLNHWIYKATLSDSGIYYLVDSLNGCWAADTTNVRIDSVFTPAISIGINPQGNLWPYVQAEFTANVNYGFNNSRLQWYKNGFPLPNDTAIVYKAIIQSDIVDGDIICVGLKNRSNCVLADTANDCLQPVQVNTSIKNANKNVEVKVYPNPASDKIIVKGTYSNSVVQLYDIYGILILEQFSDPVETEISISNIAPGIYSLRLFNIKNQLIVYTIAKI